MEKKEEQSALIVMLDICSMGYTMVWIMSMCHVWLMEPWRVIFPHVVVSDTSQTALYTIKATYYIINNVPENI